MYNTSAPADPVVEPETLDAYEIGLKTTLLDRRLRFNIAGFRYDYKNIQLQKVNGASTTLLNAAKARIWGMDADLDAVIADGLSIRAGGQWLNHKYLSFPDAPFTMSVVGGGNLTIPADASGNKMIRTPDWVVSTSVNYETEIGTAGKVAFNVSYAYNDGYFWEPGNRVKQEPYEVVNTQVKWTEPNGNLSVRVWGRNIFNEKYYTHEAEQSLGDLAAVAPGRTYGVSVGVEF